MDDGPDAGKMSHAVHHHVRHRHGHRIRKYAMALAAIILIAAALVLFVSFSGSSPTINSAYNITATSAGATFILEGSQYVASLVPAGTGTTSVYLTKTPVFVNPTIEVSLTTGNITKVNYGYEYANIGLKLESHNSTAAVIQVTPLFQSLAIAPDVQSISYVSYNGMSSGTPQPQSAPVPAAGSNTPATTTVLATTTVPSTNSTLASIDYALYNDSYYALVLNFTAQYRNSTQCTAPLYNSTYIRLMGYAPRGPSSYQNMSALTPTDLKQSISEASGTEYNVKYTAVSGSSVTNGYVAITITVDASSRTIVSDSISSSGIFSGQTESQLKSALSTAESAGNSCGILIG